MKGRFLLFFIWLLLFAFGFSQENEGTIPTPDQYREMIAQSVISLNVTGEQVSNIENITIPGAPDNIPLRIYYPAGKGPFPIIYHIHGGCWVAGDLDTHDNICRFLANHVESIVIAVDYRQPPEDKFPAPFDDCYTALKWIFDNAEGIGGDKNRIALLGDSSGGNLVAAVCLKNREEGNPVPILMQVLVNPVLDLRENSSTYNTFRLCTEAYLDKKEDSLNAFASPLSADSFRNLPQALVITSEYDDVKDEGELFYSQLLKDGVDAAIFELPAMSHLSALWPGSSKETDNARELVVKELINSFR